MNWRVIILAILAASCAAGAYYMLAEKPAADLSATTQFVYGLSEDASGISQVTIEVPEGVRFSARLIDNEWQATHLAENQTFPVDHAQLQKLVEQVTQARVVERKTSNPEYYTRLGVASLDSIDANANRVTFTAATSRYAFHVGKPSAYGSGQFVREKDAAQVLLINNVITLPRAPTDWLVQQVLPFSIDELTRVTVTMGQQADRVFVRDQNQQWQWQAQDESQALRYPTVVEDALTSMLALSYESVTTYQNAQWESLDEIASIRLEFVSGQQRVVHLSAADEIGNHQLWVESINTDAWLNNWVFTVAPYQAEALMLEPDNLVVTR